MGIVINNVAYDAIYSYYMNMYQKFHHEWGIEEIHKLIDKTFDGIYQIENGLIRRRPTISRWNGLYMATSKDRKWNFAYRIEGETIYVEDACHAQNMHESKRLLKLTESQFKDLLIECATRYLMKVIY